LEATGAVDDVTITGTAVVSPDGVEADAEVGISTTVSGDANVTISTGLEATGAVGDAEGRAGAVVEVTGLEATSAVGEIASVTGSAVVSPTGVSATGEVGAVIIWGRIVPDPGTVYSEIDPSTSTTWTEIAA